MARLARLTRPARIRATKAWKSAATAGASRQRSSNLSGVRWRNVAIGVGHCSGGVRLVSIQADLPQHGPLQEGPETHLLTIAPLLKEHRHPAGHDDEDAGCGLALSHQLTARRNGAGGEVWAKLVSKPSWQSPLLSVAFTGIIEETVLAPSHAVVEIDLIPDHIVVLGYELGELGPMGRDQPGEHQDQSVFPGKQGNPLEEHDSR